MSPPTSLAADRTHPLVVGAAATLLAYASSFVLPRGHALFEIPLWVTPLACLLTLATVAALRQPERGRNSVILGWFGFGLTVWAAGGVLMDLLPVLSDLGVVSLPVSADWPMIGTRIGALVTAILLFRVLVGEHRGRLGQCLGCGQADGESVALPRRWLGYLGVLLALPYPVLKTNWALGGTIGLDYSDPARDGFTSGWLVVPVALIGIVLTLALTHRWGRIWPRWVLGLAGRRTPRGLLLFGGGFGSAVLLTMGAAAVPQMAIDLFSGVPQTSVEGMRAWPGMLFYTSWLLWGLVLAPATWAYHLCTRPECRHCERRPALR